MTERQTTSTAFESSAIVGELLELLVEAQQLGLTFQRGSAYVSRAYVEKQDALNKRIDAALEKARAS